MLHPHRILLALASAAVIAATGCSPAPYDPTADKAAINDSVQHLTAAVDARNIDGIMAYYVPDGSLFVYDVVTPRQYVGAAAYRKDWVDTLAPYAGPIHTSFSDWTVDTDGTLAYAHGTVSIAGTGKDGKPMNSTVRVTDVYKKVDGKWLVVHEHVSFPIDPKTMKPDLDSKL